MEFSKKYHICNSARYHQISFSPRLAITFGFSQPDRRAGSLECSPVLCGIMRSQIVQWPSAQTSLCAFVLTNPGSDPEEGTEPARAQRPPSAIGNISSGLHGDNAGIILCTWPNPLPGLTIISMLQMSKPGDRGLEKVKILPKLTQLYEQERPLDL